MRLVRERGPARCRLEHSEFRVNVAKQVPLSVGRQVANPHPNPRPGVAPPDRDPVEKLGPQGVSRVGGAGRPGCSPERAFDQTVLERLGGIDTDLFDCPVRGALHGVPVPIGRDAHMKVERSRIEAGQEHLGEVRVPLVNPVYPLPADPNDELRHWGIQGDAVPKDPIHHLGDSLLQYLSDRQVGPVRQPTVSAALTLVSGWPRRADSGASSRACAATQTPRTPHKPGEEESGDDTAAKGRKKDVQGAQAHTKEPAIGPVANEPSTARNTAAKAMEDSVKRRIRRVLTLGGYGAGSPGSCASTGTPCFYWHTFSRSLNQMFCAAGGGERDVPYQDGLSVRLCDRRTARYRRFARAAFAGESGSFPGPRGGRTP